MGRRVTIRDIARVLGCHHTTVSLALRGNPRLPASTIATVKAQARAMGYAPDPAMQVLSAYRNSIKLPTDHGTLGWLTNDRVPLIGGGYAFQQYVEGASSRAAELGYRIEEFVLRAPRDDGPPYGAVP